MAIVVPEKVGDARPLTMVNPKELEIIRAAASDAAKLPELAALLPILKTFVFGKGMIEQDFRFPDGTIQTFNLWHSPGARPVIMFPVTRNGEVIALRQWRLAAAFSAPEECLIIELPGGNPKKGTNPTDEEIADAELLEETGYRAREWRPLLSRRPWWEPANFTPPFDPMLATHCVQTSPGQPDKYEYIEPAVFPLREWIALIMNGGVRDSKSIAITFLGLLRLGMIELKLP